MTFSLDDLSPAALETLAELIEERLENPHSGFEPATWHQAQAQRSAERELNAALDDAGRLQLRARRIPAEAGSATLH